MPSYFLSESTVDCVLGTSISYAKEQDATTLLRKL